MTQYIVKWLLTLFVILAMVSFAWAGDIHDAAKNGNLESLQKILSTHDGALNTLDKSGRTPLMTAAWHGQTAAVALLLKKGAKINAHAQGDQNRTALHYAAWKGHTDTVRLLLKMGARVDAPEVDGETPLHYAAASNPKTLQLLMEKGADIQQVSSIGTTPLYYAVLHGNEKTARFLLKKGAPVKIKHENKLTLAHLAARSKLPLDLVTALMDEKGAANRATTFGYTPLHYAVLGQRCDVAAMLVNKGASSDHAAESGETPLLLAIRQGDDKMTALLLKAGADAGAVNAKLGCTPLTDAASRGYAKMVNQLLQAGADPNQPDKFGKTPMQYAFRRGHKMCAKTLLAGGGRKDEKLKKLGRFGHSPLLKKALEDEQAIVWYLGHSGWAIKTRNHLLVFDYFSPYAPPDEPLLANGHIDPEELKTLNVTVLVSHGHQDHYDPQIFKWRKAIPNIHYLLGFKPDTQEKFTYLPPRKTIKGNGMTVTSFKSNDQGVGFFVEADGMKILHMGDHANGDVKMAGDFTPEIDFLVKSGKTQPHLFFTPVSGCRFRGRLDALRKGVHYVFKTLQPATLFPMHGLNREKDYRAFAEKCAAEGLETAFCCASAPGDIFAWFNGKVKGSCAIGGVHKKKKIAKHGQKKACTQKKSAGKTAL